jgi:hypothetical protein
VQLDERQRYWLHKIIGEGFECGMYERVKEAPANNGDLSN